MLYFSICPASGEAQQRPASPLKEKASQTNLVVPKQKSKASFWTNNNIVKYDSTEGEAAKRKL